MKRLTLLFVATAALAWGQCGQLAWNALTHQWNCSGPVGSSAIGATVGGALTGTLPNPTLAYVAVRAVTGTTDALVPGDRDSLVTYTNASPIAVSIAVATGFSSGWKVDILNSGAGALTLTPTTSTVEGAATLVLTTAQSARITSNGTNYRAVRSYNTIPSGTPGGTEGQVQVNISSAFAGRTVGSGLTLDATNIAVDDTLVMMLGGIQTVTGAKMFSATLTVSGASAVLDATGAKTKPVELVGSAPSGACEDGQKRVLATGVEYNCISATWGVMPLAVGLSATLTEARFPALDGDVTTTAGDLTTAIAANAVTPAKMSAIGRTRAMTFILTGSGTAGVLQDTDDQPAIFYNSLGQGITITGVSCKTDSATASRVLLQRDDGTPANFLTDNTGAGLDCSSTRAAGALDGTEEHIASTHSIDFVMVTAGGAGKWVSVTITYTLD